MTSNPVNSLCARPLLAFALTEPTFGKKAAGTAPICAGQENNCIFIPYRHTPSIDGYAFIKY